MKNSPDVCRQRNGGVAAVEYDADRKTGGLKLFLMTLEGGGIDIGSVSVPDFQNSFFDKRGNHPADSVAADVQNRADLPFRRKFFHFRFGIFRNPHDPFACFVVGAGKPHGLLLYSESSVYIIPYHSSFVKGGY